MSFWESRYIPIYRAAEESLDTVLSGARFFLFREPA
jgi:hypothetical protein